MAGCSSCGIGGRAVRPVSAGGLAGSRQASDGVYLRWNENETDEVGHPLCPPNG